MLVSIIILLLIGFTFLFFGAKIVVQACENIAKQFNISQLLIGLTILSIGTSLPEISISIMGGIDKVTGIDPNVDELIIGNVVGSFFTQITLILGLLGLTQSIFVSRWELKRIGIVMIVSVFIFLFCAIDGVISRADGLIMILFYCTFLLFIIWSQKEIDIREKEIREFLAQRDGGETTIKTRAPLDKSLLYKNIGIFLIGLLILLVGAEISLLSAHALAIELNIPANVIGILILGLGTSLPELVADLTALKRKSEGIAIGDILGSNICDILFATGSGAVISEFNVPMVVIYFDIPMLLIAVGLTYYFLWSGNSLKRWEAMLLISFYGFYAILKLTMFH